MGFWVREILGWLLVGLGLFLFVICFLILLSPPAPGSPGILEAGQLTVIGVFVFRGGIHLLKVAVAARVCLQAQAELARQAQPDRKKAADAPWDW
jgi:uncharacterized membrane protein